jgi:hypothetical protein
MAKQRFFAESELFCFIVKLFLFPFPFQGAAWLAGCGVAQSVARRLAVWQARVRISARHPRGGPLPSGSNEEIKSGTRRVLYIKYCMYAR